MPPTSEAPSAERSAECGAPDTHSMGSSEPSSSSQAQPSSSSGDSHELRDHTLERSRLEEEANAPKKPRACMGALFFNQRRYDKQRPPLCAGLRKRLQEGDVAGLPTDSVPGGDFKYICVGYSAYDEEGLKRAAARRSSEADAVTLPYCEGLEIISAAALNSKPGLLGAGGPNVNSQHDNEHGAQDPRRRSGRSYVPGAPEIPEGMTFEKFRERFMRMSVRMVEKMQSNGAFMVGHVKRTWQQVFRELSGGGGGGDKGGGGSRDY